MKYIYYDIGCCQRPRISNGFLTDAKTDGLSIIEKLQSYLSQSIPVLVFEPSCASALLDDLPDLLKNVDGSFLHKHVIPVESFILNHIRRNGSPNHLVLNNKTILIHSHCHQKALFAPEQVIEIFKAIDPGVQITHVDSGCCGMAGAFGYEREHYEISKQMAERKLIPAILAFDQMGAIVANGFSCRHQIADFSNRKAHHFMELLNITA